MKLLVTDWMSSMGIAALVRFDINRRIKVKGNMVEIPDDFFDNTEFVTAFFTTLLNESNRSRTLIERINKDIEWVVKRNFSDKQQKQKLKDYFKKDNVKRHLDVADIEMHQLVADILTEIDSAFKQKDEAQLRRVGELATKYFMTERVAAKYNLNFVRSIVLNSATFGQVSFLNTSLAGADYTSVCTIMKKDFLDDISFEWKLQKAVNARDEVTVKQLFLNYLTLKKASKKEKFQISDYVIANSYIKSHRKEKFHIEQPNTIDWEWFDNLERCALFPNQWATVPYVEKIFMSLASTSVNDRWDLQASNVPHVSSFARLLLFIAPLACAEYQLQEDYMRAFFYIPNDCARTIRENNRFRREIQGGNTLGDAITDSVSLVTKKENRRVGDTMLIEFCSYGAKTKKTVLRYSMLDPYILSLLSGTSMTRIRWGLIYPYPYRNELISRVLQNKVVNNLIYLRFLETMKLPFNERYSSTLIESAKLLDALSKREDDFVSNSYLTSYKMMKDGQKIREKYEMKKAGKKLDGHVYSLLKTVQAVQPNRRQFLKVVFRLYLTSEVEFRPEIGLLSDEKLFSNQQFTALAFAFLGGLAAPAPKEKDKEKGNDDENVFSNDKK